ncbi:MAG: molybdopterin-dependent oxidoreductase [Desulfobacteraceae bacterium]|nr:molybdopterin-dependent oxidoreductase [Desulfobacteraceae bacterium]
MKNGKEQKRKISIRGDKTIFRGLGFIGIPADSNSVQVDTSKGRILRIRPFRYDCRYKNLKPWKMEARGKTFQPDLKSLIPPYTLGYKNRVYSPNRVLYPLKRVDWNPNGERNTQNRGTSKYVRISWEEALDIVAGELQRIKKQYGMEAVLSQSDGHGETKIVHAAHGCHRKLLRLLGGYTLQTRNTDSWEGWYWGAKHVWGCENLGQLVPVTNVMWDVSKNSDGILFWGCDPETTPWGFDGQLASRLCYWFTELGIKSVYVCPDLNYGAAVHADKWIPVLPNTDAALYLSIAYVWITEGTYDQEYVKTHTVGFEKFRDYVLGKEDNTLKTPEWGEHITGVPSYTIKALARYWAKHTVSCAIGNGGPGIRGPYATEPARLQALLLAMQGVGKPGAHQFKMIEWGLYNKKSNNPLPWPEYIPDLSSATRGWLYTDTPRQFIPKDLIHDAILRPPITWYGTTLSRDKVDQQFIKYKYPLDDSTEVHMIWTDSPSWITCWNDTNDYVRALKSPKIEFILAQHPWMENDCQMADLILPSLTAMECDDFGAEMQSGIFNVVFDQPRAINPRGESKSDYEIVCAIAEKLGLTEEYTEGKSVKDWIKTGYETCGIASDISWEEFKEKGYYPIAFDENWKNNEPGGFPFYRDPENNPLSTPSGKIEFYSERLASNFPGDEERPPVPRWIPCGESHQESLSCKRAQKYPFLVVTNHPRWRVHSQHDDMIWLREINTCKVKGPDGYLYEPVWINPKDAAAKNISAGDIVKIFNERGALLAGARLTERIRHGAVYIDHGARWDPIIAGKLDRGGAINTIAPHNTTSKNATGMVCSGFLVDIEYTDIDSLRKKYPEAFKKPYHRAAGLCLERIMAKEEGNNL